MIRPEDLVWRPAHHEHRPVVVVRTSSPKTLGFKFTYVVADDVHTFEPQDNHDIQNARQLVADFWRLIAEHDSRYDGFWTTESWRLSIVAGALRCTVEIKLQSEVEIDLQHVELGKRWLAQYAEVSP